MPVSLSISWWILLVMVIFMLLALFGALAVPFWVWVIWSIVALVIHAIGR